MIGDVIDGAIVVLAGLKARLARPAPVTPAAALPPAATPPAPAPAPRTAGAGPVVMRMLEREAEVLGEFLGRLSEPVMVMSDPACACPSCEAAREGFAQLRARIATLRAIGERARGLSIDYLAERCAAVPAPTDGGRQHG